MSPLLRSLLLAALAPAAHAQSILHTFVAEAEFDWFGSSVSSAGDVNGDGHADLIVGAPGQGAKNRGNARVFSGLDGSVLHTFSGASQGVFFGTAVSDAGDVNADGFGDLIVGAWGGGINWGGYAQVFSGSDGSTLHTFDGASSGGLFGNSVSGAGDVNGDGYADLIVGAPNDAISGTPKGSAQVFSGMDGSLLYRFEGDISGFLLGSSVDGAGDVNGDGFSDLIVGASKAELARVYSGKDGSILYTLDPPSWSDQFGASVCGPGDVNGDGFDDLFVGAPTDDDSGTKSGSASVFSGADGSILYTFHGDSEDDRFGESVDGAGDVNLDGYADLLVGAPLNDDNGENAGSMRVLSGADGSILYTIGGDSSVSHFGKSVSGAGDVNGDGIDDVIGGAPWDDESGPLSGNARVFSGCDACDVPIGQSYCGPAPLNSIGQSAVITAVGNTHAQTNSCTLTSSQLPQNVWGYFLNSDVQGFRPLPPGSQGTLCLGASIGRHVDQVANTGGTGQLIIDVDLTALPRPGGTHTVVAGETWNFQCWFRDANPSPTSNFTDGVSVTFH